MRRTVPGLFGDRAQAFEQISRESNGTVVRLNLGVFRPYLVVSPKHVQRVLRDNASNYVREGMFWKPVRRLLGDGLFGEGPAWEYSRSLAQPIFTARNVGSLSRRMIDAIEGIVGDVIRGADDQGGVEPSMAMTRVVSRTVIRLFFANRISDEDADRLIPALDKVGNSMGARMLMPFVPDAIPLPGDAAFLGAVRTVDEVMVPMIRAAGEGSSAGDADVVSRLCQAHGANAHAASPHGASPHGADPHASNGHGPDDDPQVRNDIVSLFTASTETSADALTWAVIMLGAHPEIAERLYAEIDDVVGSGPLAPEHVAELRYTKMVLQETLRMYSSGWIIPRMAVKDDVIDGVAIKGGSTVLLSPYLTHRVPEVWPDPDVFDPERFSPEKEKARPPFSYIPFGGGPHMCLGQHFFFVEGQMVLASLLRRRRPRFTGPVSTEPRLVTTLKPPLDMEMVLDPTPRHRTMAEDDDAALAEGRRSALGAAVQRDLSMCLKEYDGLLPAGEADGAFLGLLARSTTFSASWLPSEDLRLLARLSLWIFAADHLVDTGAANREQVDALVDGWTAVAEGGPASEEPAARLLADIRAHLAQTPAFAGLGPLWTLQVRRMLDAMTQEFDWSRPGTPRPDIDEYLPIASASVGFGVLLLALWMLDGPPDDADASRLTALAASTDVVLRLVNDLGTIERDRDSGDLNALLLGPSRDDIAAKVSELTAAVRRKAEPLRDRHAGLVSFVERNIGFSTGIYGVGDYRG